MEKHYEVISKTIEILETLDEAIMHIENQLKELRTEESFLLLSDIMDGITSIEKAIQPVLKSHDDKSVYLEFRNIKSIMREMISLYEDDDSIFEIETRRGNLIATYRKLRSELEDLFGVYLLS